MAEQETENAPQVIFQKVYLADASLEVPNAPEIFTREWQPEVDVQIQNAVEGMPEGLHRVILTVTVTARLGGDVAYLAEVHQCGLFTIVGYDEQVSHAILGSYCPTVLLPFVRETISDLIQRGGFPQFLLQPVDFEALYREHMEQGQGENAGMSSTRH